MVRAETVMSAMIILPEEFMVSSFYSTSVFTTVNLLSQKTDYTIPFLYFVLAEKRIAVKLKETPENNTL